MSSSADFNTLPHSQPSRDVLVLVLPLFLLSGASGLIYEVIWTRLLLTVFGATLYAVATVLAAFMGGLALGSLLGGSLADRARRPLALYGILEIAIAGAALAVPWALGLFDPLYRAVYASGQSGFLELSLLRFALSFAVLLVPTTCMGATLPLLSRFLVWRSSGLGARIGGLYSANTLGAVAGTFLAGFYCVAHFGVSGTIHLAAGLSALTGVVALLLSLVIERVVRVEQGTEAQPEPETSEAPEVSPAMARLVLCSYGVSGFVALAYQVLWTRALVFRFEYLKNTTYSFSAMLTVFLAGLALGGAAMSARIDRQRTPVRLYGLLQILIGVAGALSLFMLMRFVNLLPLSDPLDLASGDFNWHRAVFNIFARTVATIGLPTFLMGMTFPVVAKICVRRLGSVGAGVGRLYAVNTIGAILGAFAAGFVLIPLFGLARGFLALGLVNVLIGSIVLLANPAEERRHKVGWSALALVAFAVFFLRVPQSYFFQDLEPSHKMIAYEEGPLATVAVAENSIGDRTIYVDNVGVAGTDPILLTDQKSLAHMPMLLLDTPKTALTVGFGSGGASWSFLQYEQLERVDCVEICLTVPYLAPLLKDSNHGVLDEWDGGELAGRTLHNGRYRMLIDDARSYLRFTEARYDVIATDCTDLRYKSNANLYDVAYFELCKQALTEDGMVVVWMPLGGMSPEVFACAMNTFAAVFPGELTTVWYMNNQPTHYLLLLGTKQPLQIDLGRMAGRMEQPLVRADLQSISLGQAEKILSCFLCSASDFEADFKKRNPILNTEDRPYLEFESPKFGFGDAPLLTNLDDLRQRRRSIAPRIVDAADNAEALERLARFEQAVDSILAGHAAYRRIDPGEACERYLDAARICPEDQSVQALLQFDELQRIARVEGDASGGRADWATLVLGEIDTLQGDYAAAAERFNAVMDRTRSIADPSVASLLDRAVVGMGRCYLGLERIDRGLAFLKDYEKRLGTEASYKELLDEFEAKRQKQEASETKP